ncbi:hypothetical protein [Crateriforma spongiae]|uniref:hypothetical protein n=1 Tax=Crateriforma spongiae TaxID=2724528 RepID=UPI0039AFA8BE
MNDSPLGLFITWTVYGTFLPGDARHWRHRIGGEQPSSAGLQRWHQERLVHPVILLDNKMRQLVSDSIAAMTDYRDWTFWNIQARTNHVHVVVSAPGYRPALVRDQMKGQATRGLRRCFPAFLDRPVWTTKGDIQFLDTEADIETCVRYLSEAQDRKGRDQ